MSHFNTKSRNSKKRFNLMALLKRSRYYLIAVVSLAIGYYIGHVRMAFTLSTVQLAPFHSSLSKSLKAETVMAVGGSAAHGWADPTNNSYLQRAFQSLTDTTNTIYIYDDQTIIGGGPDNVSHQKFASWLKSTTPQVVVISWGILNDILHNTSDATFKQAIRNEINQSLQAHAVVLMVTPPVVPASVNNARFDALLQDEYAVVHAIHSSNVHWFNLNEDMAVYLQAHGQYLSDYVSGTWHPNQAGHELAGELLYNELLEQFGSQPIAFEDTTSVVERLKRGLHLAK